MKYVEEYRDAALVRGVVDKIRTTVTRPWVLMEICGGQTHALVRHGLDQLLPREIELVHGPGCPVCVTPLEQIDKALAIASRPDVILTSYGDMLRVPGSNRDLFSVRADGGDVRVVYSPLDAVKIAQANPDRQVVFFAIGFETTAPANAMSVLQAQAMGLHNYSLLVSHVCVPPAMRAILGSPGCRVQGFLAAGHVCAVMGYWEYPSIADAFRVPIVVTGFEPLDLAQGILMTVRQLEQGRAEVENAYARVVTREGQPSGPGSHRPGLRSHGPQVAWDRGHPGIGLWPAGGVLRVRRRNALRRAGDTVGGVAVMHRRRDPPGAAEAERLYGLRQGMRSGAPARGDDGLLGGRVRRVLPLRPRRGGDGMSDSNKVTLDGAVCPVSLPHADQIVMGHGSGGRMTHDLIARTFVSRLGNAGLNQANDAAVLHPTEAGEIAITTDSHIVSPLFFPGGDIGRLAICGTVNDLAMVGALRAGSRPDSSSRKACCSRPLNALYSR